MGVPVSGLALNYFHRMQMELKTIIEIWAPRKERRKKLSSSTDPTKPRSKTLWSTAEDVIAYIQSPTKSTFKEVKDEIEKKKENQEELKEEDEIIEENNVEEEEEKK